MTGRYKLYIDGNFITDSNHIPNLKKQAVFWFDYCNAFSAQINIGKKMYCQAFYNSKHWNGRCNDEVKHEA